MVIEDARLLPPGIVAIGVDLPVLPGEEAELGDVVLCPVVGLQAGIDRTACAGIQKAGDNPEIINVGYVFGKGKTAASCVTIIFA